MYKHPKMFNVRIGFWSNQGKDAADYLDFAKIESLEDFKMISIREKLFKRKPKFAMEV